MARFSNSASDCQEFSHQWDSPTERQSAKLQGVYPECTHYIESVNGASNPMLLV